MQKARFDKVAKTWLQDWSSKRKRWLNISVFESVQGASRRSLPSIKALLCLPFQGFPLYISSHLVVILHLWNVSFGIKLFINWGSPDWHFAACQSMFNKEHFNFCQKIACVFCCQNWSPLWNAEPCDSDVMALWYRLTMEGGNFNWISQLQPSQS